MAGLDIRDILGKLAPLKNRMHLNRGIQRFLLCLCAGSSVSMVVSYISLLFPIPFVLSHIAIIFLVSTAAGLVAFAFSAPSEKELIMTADSLGLKERIITAWQLKNENTPIALIQRYDAYNAVLSADFKNLYPLIFPKKLGVALCAVLLVTTVSFFIPANARDSAHETEKLKNEIKRQVEEISKAGEKLKEERNLSEEELEKINEELERLKEELRKASSEDEALKALKRTENQLEKLDINKQLQKLGEMLGQHQMTEKAGDALKALNAEDLKKALEELISQMRQGEISTEEFARLLKEISEQAGGEILTEMLKNTSNALDSGDMESSAKAIEDLGRSLSGLIESQSESSMSRAMAELSQALQNAKRSISMVESKTSKGSSSGKGALSNQPAASGQKQGHGNEQSINQGLSQGNGNGRTNDQGQSPAKGSQDGGGAGEGSTNKDSGYTGSGQQVGRKPGSGYEEAYERLYDPEYLGGDSDPSYVSGQSGRGGESSYSETGMIPAGKGAVLPYIEVLRRYKNKASSYMEEASIPAAMKDIVRQYFESLE